MKRFGLGIVLLILLLLGSLATWWGMGRLHRPIVQELTEAVVLAEDNDPAAKETAMKAKDRWQRNWHFAASFSDHTPMEEIDNLFAELEVFEPASEEFKACCRRLIQRTEAMVHAHSLSWWDLL